MSFLKICEKITKNFISWKLQKIGQSYLKARVAIFEITLTGPNYRVGNFRFLETYNNLSSLKIFEKITKNIISRKLQKIEQSYLEAWGWEFQILQKKINVSFLKFQILQGWEFQILQKKINVSFLKFLLKKLQKTPYLENYKKLRKPNNRVGNFRFLKIYNNLSFLKIFEKITKNFISRKLQKIEQSYLEARVAIFEITLTGPSYRVGNFRFCNKKI